MPLKIGRVDTEMDLLSPEPGGEDAPTSGRLVASSELRERLRPLVLEILEEHLERLRRERI